MKKLNEYLDVKTLQQLQDAFAMVSGLPIRLCDAEGVALTKVSLAPRSRSKLDMFQLEPGPAGASGKKARTAAQPWCHVPVVVAEEVVGRIELATPAVAGAPRPDLSSQILRYLGLMSNVLSRMCDREQQLTSRIEELAALYRLTTEFTNRRDVQSMLNLVASTVVDVLKAKACSIRLLSEDHKELLIKAVAKFSPRYLNKGPILVSKSQIDSEVLSTFKPVYIADERTDPRVLYSAEARREGIVSALVAPLVYKGHPEGVLHVYTGKRHKFDSFEVSLLMAIAGEAAAAIVNSRLYEEAVRSAQMKRQMAMAAEVQRRMIPSHPPEAPGCQIAALYAPSYDLGGDFFDFIPLPPDNLGIAICDVVGKGVRASLLMASIRASLRAHASSIYDMASVVSRVNRDLCADVLASDFATLFYGVLDHCNRRFTYVNAGHPAPMLLRPDGTTDLSAGGMVLGIEPQNHWQCESVALRAGDVVLAFTDGLTEAMNFDDEPFGKARIEKAARAAIASGQSAEGIIRHVLWEMRRFAGLSTRLDDLTVLAVKVLG